MAWSREQLDAARRTIVGAYRHDKESTSVNVIFTHKGVVQDWNASVVGVERQKLGGEEHNYPRLRASRTTQRDDVGDLLFPLDFVEGIELQALPTIYCGGKTLKYMAPASREDPLPSPVISRGASPARESRATAFVPLTHAQRSANDAPRLMDARDRHAVQDLHRSLLGDPQNRHATARPKLTVQRIVADADVHTAVSSRSSSVAAADGPTFTAISPAEVTAQRALDVATTVGAQVASITDTLKVLIPQIAELKAQARPERDDEIAGGLKVINDNQKVLHASNSNLRTDMVALAARLDTLAASVAALDASVRAATAPVGARAAQGRSDTTAAVSAVAAQAAALGGHAHATRGTLLSDGYDDEDGIDPTSRALGIDTGDLLDPMRWPADAGAQRTILRRILEEIVAPQKPEHSRKLKKLFETAQGLVNDALATFNGGGSWVRSVDCMARVHLALLEVEIYTLMHLRHPSLLAADRADVVRQSVAMHYENLRGSNRQVSTFFASVVASANQRAVTSATRQAAERAEPNSAAPVAQAASSAPASPNGKSGGARTRH